VKVLELKYCFIC